MLRPLRPPERRWMRCCRSTMSETSCNRRGRKGQLSPGPQRREQGRRGLRDLGSVEVPAGDRMVMVLVSDGDQMVILLGR